MSSDFHIKNKNHTHECNKNFKVIAYEPQASETDLPPDLPAEKWWQQKILLLLRALPQLVFPVKEPRVFVAGDIRAIVRAQARMQ